MVRNTVKEKVYGARIKKGVSAMGQIESLEISRELGGIKNFALNKAGRKKKVQKEPN